MIEYLRSYFGISGLGYTVGLTPLSLIVFGFLAVFSVIMFSRMKASIRELRK